MAKDKKGFMLYADQQELFEQLTDEQAGKLIKHIYNYVNDNDPISKDIITNIAFVSIKQQLKRDLKKWESIAERNRTNGLKGGRPKIPNKPNKPTGLLGNPNKPKKPVKDNVKVKVKDNVKDKEIKIEYAEFVKLKVDEYIKLESEHTTEGANEMIQILNNYKESNGKTYKSDYGAINSWVVGEYEKRKLKQQAQNKNGSGNKFADRANERMDYLEKL